MVYSGQIARPDVEWAGGDQGIKFAQIDANGSQAGHLCG